MEIIVYKGRPFSVFVDGFVSYLHYYSCTATTLYGHFETSRSNRMMAATLNFLMRSDQEDGYLKNVHSLADGQMVTK